MVETDATSRSRARRLLVLLGCILVVTGLGVSLLVLVNRPTVVELKVSVRQIDLDIESPSESMVDPDSAYALRRVSLLDPGLVLTSLEAKDFECIETTLETVGRVVLRPSSGGSVILNTMGTGDSGAGVEGQGAADEAETFQAELIIQDPLRLSIEAPGRNSLLMKLQPSGMSTSSSANGSQPSSRSPRCSEPAEGDWSGQISTGVEMTAGLRNVRVASLDGRVQSDISGTRSYRVLADADSITILGGRRASRLNLALPLDGNPSTWMRVLDPATGEVVATRRLPFALSEARVIPWRDRIVLLDMNPGESWPVLRPNLRVGGIEFSRRVELEANSYVTGGKVRFPAGEKEAIEIEPDSFLALSLNPDEPLTLRSIAFSRGGLDLVLWGEPTSLRLGPTPELRVECLPSYLEWLLAHRLAQLIYVVLAWIAGSTLALLKILGLLDK